MSKIRIGVKIIGLTPLDLDWKFGDWARICPREFPDGTAHRILIPGERKEIDPRKGGKSVKERVVRYTTCMIRVPVAIYKMDRQFWSREILSRFPGFQIRKVTRQMDQEAIMMVWTDDKYWIETTRQWLRKRLRDATTTPMIRQENWDLWCQIWDHGREACECR